MYNSGSLELEPLPSSIKNKDEGCYNVLLDTVVDSDFDIPSSIWNLNLDFEE